MDRVTVSSHKSFLSTSERLAHPGLLEEKISPQQKARRRPARLLYTLVCLTFLVVATLVIFGYDHRVTNASSPLVATCTWNGTSGDWADSSRWSCGTVPGAEDTAIIPAGTVTVSGDVTVANVQLTGGTVTCNAHLIVSSLMTWSAGTINGSASGQLILNGALTMTGSSQKFLAASFINNGTINWQEGQFILSSTLTNQSGATMNIGAAGPLSAEGGVISNAGTLNKVTSSSSDLVNLQLNNSGAMNINAGTLRLLSSNQVVAPTGSINGSGTLELSGGTTTINGAFNLNGAFKISGGTTNFNTATNIASLELTAGTLAGSGAVTIVGSMLWTGGAVQGSGAFDISSVGNLLMTGSSQKSLGGRSLSNNGTILWQDGQFVLSSSVSNLAGATFNIQSAGPLTASGIGSLTNAGIIAKVGGVSTLFDGVSFNNSGTLNVDTGALSLGNGSTTSNSGSYNVALGTTLTLGFGTHLIEPVGSLNGSGTLQLFGNTSVNGAFNLTGEVNISGGVTTVSAPTSINSLSLTTGTLAGTAAVTINGSMTWSGGTIQRTGALIISPTATLSVSGTAFKFLKSTIINNGVGDYNGGEFQFDTGGVLEIGPGGSFSLNTSNPVEGSGVIQNAGTFRKIGGNPIIVRPQFNNSGHLEITSTTISFEDFFGQAATVNQTSGITLLNDATLSGNFLMTGGILAGSGTVFGNLTNSGMIAPGLTSGSAGTITISKNYTQTATGFLEIELGGTDPGVASDLLATNTVAATTSNFAGTLNVSLLNGFRPAADTSFQIARYLAHTGSFATTNGLDLGGGQLLNADYRSSEAVLVAGTGGGAVPWVQVVAEPPTIRKPVDGTFDFNYKVHIGNSGGESTTVIVVLEIKPEEPGQPIEKDDIEDLISNSPLVSPEDPGVEQEFENLPKKIPMEDGTVVIPFAMVLPPLSSFVLPGKFKSLCSGSPKPPGEQKPLGQPRAKIFGHAISLPSSECIADLLKFALGFLPAKDCIDEILKFILKQSVDPLFARPVNAVSFLASAFVLAAKCAKSVLPPVVQIALKIYGYLSKGKDALKALSSCLGSILPDPESPQLQNADRTECVDSKDPNDKVGPPGIGADRFISGTEALRYSVFFENVPTATAPAQTVSITDQLDPSLLNFNTFALGPISFANKSVSPAPNSSSFTTDVDMRPQKNVIVRVHAELNRTSGLLTWLFTSLDPTNGQPLPPSSIEGFLDPNVNPPQGQGLVVFSVSPKSNLPSGTIIKNKANITFDQNALLATPEWLNTIDNGKPASQVQSLAASQCSSFRVQWSGTDTTSGIAHYSIFVSKNGEAVEPWLLYTNQTSEFFNGVPGNTYAFYSIARDGAGNVETVPNQPDASATVTTQMTIAPGNQSFSAAGGSSTIQVTAGSCDWIAQSKSSFITINSGANGSGDGSVGYTVAPNTTNESREGVILIAGNQFLVEQSATSTPTTVGFSASTYTANEADQHVTITVTRSGDTTGGFSVLFNTSSLAGSQVCTVFNGAASARCDYESRFARIRFAPGETFKTISLLLIDDSYLEGPESFTVTLSSPIGAALGAQSSSTVSVVDNELITGANPVDTAAFFVRQHYFDFFTREPDSGGLNFWTGDITSCSTTQCMEVKRINVSAAFFLSIEFQETGYLVERLYKTSFGEVESPSSLGGQHLLKVPVIHLDEFLMDTQEIGSGVVVGQPGWEQVLENNKIAFINEFVQRSRFTSAFPISMTPSQFIDQLDANAGKPLSTTERNQLVADFTAGTKTRAQVLRAIAEDGDLKIAEFNRAFVLMQYFGYLRRNPNENPDSDYTGYDFWLTKLNQFNGNFINSEMVKAFITSDEYRRRFGP